MEMDVEGVSPRPEPIPRSQGAGGACQAPPQPPQPQPQPQQQLAQDEVPSESAGAEDSDDPEARPNGERGESKRLHGLQADGLQCDHCRIHQIPNHWQLERTSPLRARRRGKQAGRRPITWLERDGPPSPVFWKLLKEDASLIGWNKETIRMELSLKYFKPWDPSLGLYYSLILSLLPPCLSCISLFLAQGIVHRN
ncbi:hypothetical protein LEMLEM_LOCUS22129 [Lemmus lemmus]